MLVTLLACAGLCSCGPHSTALPLDVDDLTPIQADLDRLPPEERELVVGYLKRSNGDVLPAQFADPDEPFTARTFGQAIVLQREFLVKQALRDRDSAARAAQREATIKPLREVLSLRLVKRELLTGDEIYGIAPPPTSGPKVGRNARSDRYTIQVMTYRLTNRSDRDIATFSGSAEIPGEGLMPAAQCWIDEHDTLPAHATREVRCGQPNRPANDEERLAVTRPWSQIVLVWEPAEVHFSDGQVLKAQR